MKASPAGQPSLYDRLAEDVRGQILRGALRPGDRMPSLRHMSRRHRVSLSTTIQAYQLLETQGHLEARPKSGFFVRVPPATAIHEPRSAARSGRPAVTVHHAILREDLTAAGDLATVPFDAP